MPRLPAAAVFRLFAYAWELWPDGPPTPAGAEPSDDLPTLLARVLTADAERLLRRGPVRHFQEEASPRRRPRGRIDIAAVCRQPGRRVELPCVADELRDDGPANRLIAHTLDSLARTTGLDRRLRSIAASLAKRFPGHGQPPGDPVHVPRSYRRPVSVCRLIREQMSPTAGTGYTFADVAGDERYMSRVFEAFVRTFYRQEQTLYPRVGVRRFDWQNVTATVADRAHLPEMRTDVTLEAEDRLLVIDAKYYADPLTAFHDARSVHAGHLYQLFAYLTNLAALDPRPVTGLLLYPSNGEEIDLRYELHGHRVRVAAVDLAGEWAGVKARLLSLIE